MTSYYQRIWIAVNNIIQYIVLGGWWSFLWKQDPIDFNAYWYFYTHLDTKKYHVDYQQRVQNINWVSRHGFYPFIHFQMDCSKYTNDSEGNKFIKEKTRDIYYAAHIDRFIYEYYGNRLKNRYNKYMKLKVIIYL